MITTVVTITDADKSLQRVFGAEQQDILQDRASYGVGHDQGKTTIEVSAKDGTALRAILNSVCKTIIIHEKAERTVNDGTKGSDAATGTD